MTNCWAWAAPNPQHVKIAFYSNFTESQLFRLACWAGGREQDSRAEANFSKAELHLKEHFIISARRKWGFFPASPTKY